jgi:hypothetical protein
MTNAGLRIAPRADGSHVRVAVFIVNNNPETMEWIRPHVKVGFSSRAAAWIRLANAPLSPFLPSPLAGEGTMLTPSPRMGEGFSRQHTPHPSSRAATPSRPLPQGE